MRNRKGIQQILKRSTWIYNFLFLGILLNSCTDPVIPAPESPTNLSTTVVSTNQIDLSWTDNSTNETGFKIERKTGSENYSVIASTGKDVSAYIDKGLTENSTYSYRVFAFNPAPEASNYSNESSATTLQISTISDFDGNAYAVVTIGSQLWTAENLKTTKFNDGTEIPLITDDGEWSSTPNPAYSWYNNDKSTNGTIYGALYNWYTVGSGNLCPTDWHVPTDADWATLIDYLGGESVAGGKLKEGGVAHWMSPNMLATNEVGFSALPGGYHNSNGSFNLIGEYGRWWSSTEIDSQTAGFQIIGYDSGAIGARGNLKKSGFAVRCVKD